MASGAERLYPCLRRDVGVGVGRRVVLQGESLAIEVYFAEEEILLTGDTFWNRDYPFIDYGTGGSLAG